MVKEVLVVIYILASLKSNAPQSAESGPALSRYGMRQTGSLAGNGKGHGVNDAAPGREARNVKQAE